MPLLRIRLAAAGASIGCALLGPAWALPCAQADSSTPLAQAVTAARAASDCPALQWDALVERSAAMANQATAAYISHRSAAVPFTDPVPALATIGYTASKGMVLAGYGSNEAEALHALVLEYQALKPDCTYTQFGTDMVRDDTGSAVAAAVLVTPAAQQ